MRYLFISGRAGKELKWNERSAIADQVVRESLAERQTFEQRLWCDAAIMVPPVELFFVFVALRVLHSAFTLSGISNSYYDFLNFEAGSY